MELVQQYKESFSKCAAALLKERWLFKVICRKLFNRVQSHRDIAVCSVHWANTLLVSHRIKRSIETFSVSVCDFVWLPWGPSHSAGSSPLLTKWFIQNACVEVLKSVKVFLSSARLYC